jgi:hypothetical protein
MGMDHLKIQTPSYGIFLTQLMYGQLCMISGFAMK